MPGYDWALPLVPVINLGCGWPHTFHICVKITLMCSKRLRRVAQPIAQLVRVGSGQVKSVAILTFSVLHTLPSQTKPSAHTAPSSLTAKYRTVETAAACRRSSAEPHTAVRRWCPLNTLVQHSRYVHWTHGHI